MSATRRPATPSTQLTPAHRLRAAGRGGQTSMVRGALAALLTATGLLLTVSVPEAHAEPCSKCEFDDEEGLVIVAP